VFIRSHHVILQEAVPNEVRSAYRELNGEDYVILWPSVLTEFSVS